MLKLSQLKSTLPEREVYFRENDDGVVTHHAAPGPGVPVMVRIQYLPLHEQAEMVTENVVRRVKNAKGAKEFVPERASLRVAVCERCVKGWDMTIAGLRLFQPGIDLSQHDMNERVEFSQADLAALVKTSAFGDLVYNCLGDYEFWFPAAKAQEGNSGTGCTGS